MNNLSSHVTNLELSKRLKELGFKKHSFYSWSTTESGANVSLHESLSPDHPNYNSPFYCSYPAFLSSELSLILPSHIDVQDTPTHFYGYQLSCFKDDRGRFKREGLLWHVVYMVGEKWLCSFKGSNLADALAKMLIHLAEKQIINPKELSNE